MRRRTSVCPRREAALRGAEICGAMAANAKAPADWRGLCDLCGQRSLRGPRRSPRSLRGLSPRGGADGSGSSPSSSRMMALRLSLIRPDGSMSITRTLIQGGSSTFFIQIGGKIIDLAYLGKL